MDLMFSQFDCEDSRDFGQYYRGRYFGISKGGRVRPALLNTVLPGDSFRVFEWDSTTKKSSPLTYDKNALATVGLFGCPILGNIQIGHTFAYASISPIRESLKGIAPTRMSVIFPKHGTPKDSKVSVMEYLINKNIQLRLLWDSMPGHFGSMEEFELMDYVFNRTYYKGYEAVELLTSGEKIGAAIDHNLGLYIDIYKPNVRIMFRGKDVGFIQIDSRGRIDDIHVNRRESPIAPFIISKLDKAAA